MNLVDDTKTKSMIGMKRNGKQTLDTYVYVYLSDDEAP